MSLLIVQRQQHNKKGRGASQILERLLDLLLAPRPARLSLRSLAREASHASGRGRVPIGAGHAATDADMRIQEGGRGWIFSFETPIKIPTLQRPIPRKQGTVVDACFEKRASETRRSSTERDPVADLATETETSPNSKKSEKKSMVQNTL